MNRTKIKPVSQKQAKRERDLQKIKGSVMCEICGNHKATAKHHKILRSAGGKDTPDNLQHLCGYCHRVAHKLEGQPKSIPVDKVPHLAGYGHGHAISKEMQVGKK